MKLVSLVLLAVIGLVTIVSGTGEVYAGGEAETIQPAEKEEVVVIAEEKQTKTVWFVIGFVFAIILTAL